MEVQNSMPSPLAPPAPSVRRARHVPPVLPVGITNNRPVIANICMSGVRRGGGYGTGQGERGEIVREGRRWKGRRWERRIWGGSRWEEKEGEEEVGGKEMGGQEEGEEEMGGEGIAREVAVQNLDRCLPLAEVPHLYFSSLALLRVNLRGRRGT